MKTSALLKRAKELDAAIAAYDRAVERADGEATETVAEYAERMAARARWLSQLIHDQGGQ